MVKLRIGMVKRDGLGIGVIGKGDVRDEYTV